MSRPYRPSNGAEGEMFMTRYCERCKKDSEEHPCDILGRSFSYHICDPEYPTEWIYDDDASPIDLGRCTAFEPDDGREIPALVELFKRKPPWDE